MTEQRKVAFNPDEEQLWEELQKSGMTSKPFPRFVKDAYYDAIDEIRSKRGLQGKGIEQITGDLIQKQTADTPSP